MAVQFEIPSENLGLVYNPKTQFRENIKPYLSVIKTKLQEVTDKQESITGVYKGAASTFAEMTSFIKVKSGDWAILSVDDSVSDENFESGIYTFNGTKWQFVQDITNFNEIISEVVADSNVFNEQNSTTKAVSVKDFWSILNSFNDSLSNSIISLQQNKADKQEVTLALNTKADKTDLVAGLNLLSNEIDTKLASKADTVEVANELVKKVDKTDFEATKNLLNSKINDLSASTLAQTAQNTSAINSLQSSVDLVNERLTIDFATKNELSDLSFEIDDRLTLLNDIVGLNKIELDNVIATNEAVKNAQLANINAENTNQQAQIESKVDLQTFEQRLSEKADLSGNSAQVFNVADGEADSMQAVNVKQLTFQVTITEALEDWDSI